MAPQIGALGDLRLGGWRSCSQNHDIRAAGGIVRSTRPRSTAPLREIDISTAIRMARGYCGVCGLDPEIFGRSRPAALRTPDQPRSLRSPGTGPADSTRPLPTGPRHPVQRDGVVESLDCGMMTRPFSRKASRNLRSRLCSPFRAARERRRLAGITFDQRVPRSMPACAAAGLDAGPLAQADQGFDEVPASTDASRAWLVPRRVFFSDSTCSDFAG